MASKRDIRVRFGKRVRALRDIAGLTQEQVKGIDRGYLSNIENGHINASLETIEIIAKGLKVPLYLLMPDSPLSLE